MRARGGDEFVDAAQNALVVANAERYYRVMYYGSQESWNLRDLHMFETLQMIRAHRGPDAKVIVWEHNSHIGDASATEMGARGEHNVGDARAGAPIGDSAFLVGFGTHDGVVAAATDWGGPMERKAIRPSHPDSYERLCHDSGVPAFLLHLREPHAARVARRTRRAASRTGDRRHLPTRDRAPEPLLPGIAPATVRRVRVVRPHVARRDRSPAHEVAGVPDTYPFGL